MDMQARVCLASQGEGLLSARHLSAAPATGASGRAGGSGTCCVPPCTGGLCWRVARRTRARRSEAGASVCAVVPPRWKRTAGRPSPRIHPSPGLERLADAVGHAPHARPCPALTSRSGAVLAPRWQGRACAPRRGRLRLRLYRGEAARRPALRERERERERTWPAVAGRSLPLLSSPYGALSRESRPCIRRGQVVRPGAACIASGEEARHPG